jgi:hypothetical protein
MQISDPGGTLIGNIKYWEIAIREGWHWQVNGGREMADADYKDFTFEQIAEAFEYDPGEVVAQEAEWGFDGGMCTRAMHGVSKLLRPNC